MTGTDPRGLLLEYLQRRPGSSLQDIADHLGIARTSAVHHVRVLRRERLIVVQRKGRRVIHFPVQVHDTIHRSLLAVWRVGTARRIIQELHDDPRCSWRAIARRLEITPKAVRWHLQRMEEEGLLRIERSSDGSSHLAVLHPRVRSLSEGDDGLVVVSDPRR